MKPIRFGSVCSGIEAASVAWRPLGWEAAWLSEIEPFPCALLAHHYPDVPNLGDMTKFEDWPDDEKHSIDVLCGGTPCQSFSVAGLRKGLDDPRGDLMLTFGAIAAKYRPRWLVWENVPGVLSSNGGQDFASFLGLITGQEVKVPEGGWANSGLVSGIPDAYGVAFRVLDAQYFGVAQRRRRVFVVGCIGDWRGSAAVLFERHSLQGHPAPRRESGKAAPTIPSRCSAGGGLGTDFDCDGGLIHAPAISPALKARDHKGPSSDGDGDGAPLIAHCLRGGGFDASEDGTGRGTPMVPVAFPARLSGTQCASSEDLSPALMSANPMGVACQYSHSDIGATVMQVRRLTAEECEFLQGFPRYYTAIPWRKKPVEQCPDGPRYKAIGNSWAVPCARWIGERIAEINGRFDE